MNADEIIFQALTNNPLQGEGLFIVEGNPQTNDLRALPADKAYKDNLNAFTWNINTGYQYMGIFTEEKHAQDFIENIRTRLRDEKGHRLI